MQPSKVPTRRRGSLRVLVGFLALFMVPVVIVATPRVADAAMLYGDPQHGSFRWGDLGPAGGGTGCEFDAYYYSDGGTTNGVKVVNGSCETGFSDWFSNLDESGTSVQLTFNGADPINGAACWFGTGPMVHPGDGLAWTFAGQAPGIAACHVNEVCWEVVEAFHVTFDGSASGCEPFDLGAPPEAEEPGIETSCAQFTIGSPIVTDTYGFESSSDSDWYVDHRVEIPWEWTNAQEAFDVLIFEKGALPAEGTYRSPGDSLAHRHFLVKGTATAGSIVYQTRHDYHDFGDHGSQGPTPEASAAVGIAGIQIRPEVINGDTMGPSPWDRKGWTDQGECTFWFGPKVLDDGNVATTGDEPAGELVNTSDVPTDEPEPTPTPVPAESGGVSNCTFKLSDPTTWLEGGMCAVVGLLSGIWDTIKGIPGAILDGLRGLFVPSEGYLDGRVTETRNKIEATTPGLWVDSVTDVVPGEVSGCEGIRIAPPAPEKVGGGTLFDEQLGAACEGKMAEVASMVRLAVSATVVLAGAFACVRALGAGFGWRPGVGEGIDV